VILLSGGHCILNNILTQKDDREAVKIYSDPTSFSHPILETSSKDNSLNLGNC
jgi:hypothetical protein